MSDAKEVIAAVGGNEALQNAVASLIQKSISAAEQGAGFLSEQIPDVVQQVLLWKAVESGFSMLVSLFILFLIVLVWSKFSGKGKKKNLNIDKEYGNYVITLTHDENGELSEHMFGSFILTVILFAVSMVLFSLTWLKIIIAPKLFLIEYAASLVK